jgi:hypothetical protein
VDTHLQPRSVECRAPTLSPDGYIRLPLASLNSLSFEHLFSDSDADFLQELREQTVPARSAGFSEWKSNTNPAISLGWGWFIHSESERLMLAPDGVRSNVMLIDARGYDLGPGQTSNLFCSWLDTFEWEVAVSVALHDFISPC